MVLPAPDITNRDMKASGFHDKVDFRIYNKLSQASRGFPKKISLSVTRNVGLVVKQVSGPLAKEEYVPKYHSKEDFDPAEDDTNYNSSSDETLEPLNAFGLAESSVLRATSLPGQLQPNGIKTAEGTIQYFNQVNPSKVRHNPSTGEEPSDQVPEPAPGLLIYSLTTPASVSHNSKVALPAMTAPYAFLTSVGEYSRFTAYKDRDSGSRWLVVEELRDINHFQPAWISLKKRQSKHWWWKDWWENNSLAFCSLEENRKSN